MEWRSAASDNVTTRTEKNRPTCVFCLLRAKKEKTTKGILIPKLKL